MGVQIEKVDGKGHLAGVSEDLRKRVIELYCQGVSVRGIEEQTGVSKTVAHQIKSHGLDVDSQFREKMRQISLREKLHQVADLSADRVIELMPEMSA